MSAATLTKATAKTEAAEKTVTQIESALTAAEAALGELEGKRSTIVLNGDDVDAYHADMIRTEANVKTLRATLDSVKATYAEAQAEERRLVLEAKVARVREECVDGMKQGYGVLGELLDEVAAVCAMIGSCRDRIEGQNQLSERAGRSDLMIKLPQPEAMVAAAKIRPPILDREREETDEGYKARQEAHDTEWAEAKSRAERPREELEPEEDFRRRQAEAMKAVKKTQFEDRGSVGIRRAAAKARVERKGETDEQYALRRMGTTVGVYRAEKESEVAFELRVNNAKARQQNSDTVSPLRKLGENAIEAIMQFGLGMGPHERNRRFPGPINPRSAVATDGKVTVLNEHFPAMRPLMRPLRRG